jgi:hypothetical protein
MITSIRLALATTAAGLVVACGTSPGPASPPAPAAPPPAVSPQAPAPATGAVTKVSANTASEEQIAAALEAAGVTNADRWAEEVVEYRPYPADDPNLGKLRQSLAKYNPGQETEDKIVSALTP